MRKEHKYYLSQKQKNPDLSRSNAQIGHDYQLSKQVALYNYITGEQAERVN
jgi:hypothetical protein